MNENIKNYVLELLDHINLLDYVDRTELQILKDEYVDEIESVDGDVGDWYDFIDYLEKKGIAFHDKFEIAIAETIDGNMIYNSDCVELLQINLLDSFDILNDIMYESPDFSDKFDVRLFAIHICDFVAWNWLRTELETTFIANAVNRLK